MEKNLSASILRLFQFMQKCQTFTQMCFSLPYIIWKSKSSELMACFIIIIM